VISRIYELARAVTALERFRFDDLERRALVAAACLTL
jgi:hypothetical protein